MANVVTGDPLIDVAANVLQSGKIFVDLVCIPYDRAIEGILILPGIGQYKVVANMDDLRGNASRTCRQITSPAPGRTSKRRSRSSASALGLEYVP